jgi:hypothetical protein
VSDGHVKQTSDKERWRKEETERAREREKEQKRENEMEIERTRKVERYSEKGGQGSNNNYEELTWQVARVEWWVELSHDTDDRWDITNERLDQRL